jgi:hypothetical protein
MLEHILNPEFSAVLKEAMPEIMYKTCHIKLWYQLFPTCPPFIMGTA